MRSTSVAIDHQLGTSSTRRSAVTLMRRTTTFTHPERNAVEIVAALRSAGFEIGAAEHVGRTVLDTFDRRLAERHVRLELRTGRAAELVLTDAVSPAAHVVVEDTPRFVADLPPGPFRSRVASIIEVRALLPFVTLTAARTPVTRRNRTGKTDVQLSVYDQLRVGGRARDRRGRSSWTSYPATRSRRARPAACSTGSV